MAYPTPYLHKHSKKSNAIYDPVGDERFQKLIRKEITEEEFYLEENGEIGEREDVGYKKRIRMAHNGSAYRPIDPRRHEKHCPEPPPEVKAAFEEILGYATKDECGRLRLILTMHPHIPRWCLFEVHLDPKRGERGALWHPIAFFCEEVVEGKPATDLMSDPFLRHLTCGKNALGAYRLPTKPEFEAIRRTDRKLHGVDAVDAFFESVEREPAVEADKEWEHRTADLIDYCWEDEVNHANRAAGSGWKMQSYPAETYRHKETYYRRETKNGYVLLKKRAPYVEISRGVPPFVRGRTPEELELAKLEVAAEKQGEGVTDEQRDRLRKLQAAKKESV